MEQEFGLQCIVCPNSVSQLKLSSEEVKSALSAFVNLCSARNHNGGGGGASVQRIFENSGEEDVDVPFCLECSELLQNIWRLQEIIEQNQEWQLGYAETLKKSLECSSGKRRGVTGSLDDKHHCHCVQIRNLLLKCSASKGKETAERDQDSSSYQLIGDEGMKKEVESIGSFEEDNNDDCDLYCDQDVKKELESNNEDYNDSIEKSAVLKQKTPPVNDIARGRKRRLGKEDADAPGEKAGGRYWTNDNKAKRKRTFSQTKGYSTTPNTMYAEVFYKLRENLLLYHSTPVKYSRVGFDCEGVGNCSFTVTGMDYSAFQQVKAHVFNVHSNFNEKTPRPCPMCGLLGFTGYALRNHIIKLHRPTKTICEVCWKPLHTKSGSVKKHSMTHKNAEEKAEFIATAGRSFAGKTTETRRRQYEQSKQNFKCSTCGRKFFVTKTAIQKHMRSHLDMESRKMFKCAECSAKYLEKTFLDIHIAKKHNRTKAGSLLECPICLKLYTWGQKTTYNVHLTSHAGGRRSVAYYCQARKSAEGKHKEEIDDDKMIKKEPEESKDSDSDVNNTSRKDNEQDKDPVPRPSRMKSSKFSSISAVMPTKGTHPVPNVKYADAFYELKDDLLLYHSTPIKYSLIGFECHGAGNCTFKVTGSDSSAFQQIKAHIRSVHSNYEDPRLPLRCPLCSKSESSGFTLRSHIMKCHQPANAICEVCWKPLRPRVYAIKSHLMTHKNAEEMAKFLAVASKSYARVSSERVQEFNEDTKEHFQCATCGKQFWQKRYLARHEKSHLPKTPIQESQKRYKCSQCNAKYGYKSNLNDHITRKHKGNCKPPLQCPTCPKTYPWWDKVAYEAHLRTHTGERPYQCETCGKSFPSKQHLKKHVMQVHTPPKEQCEFCPFITTTRAVLRKHQFRKHKELLHPDNVGAANQSKSKTSFGSRITYSCPDCDKVYYRKDHFTKHVHSVHYNSNHDN